MLMLLMEVGEATRPHHPLLLLGPNSSSSSSSFRSSPLLSTKRPLSPYISICHHHHRMPLHMMSLHHHHLHPHAASASASAPTSLLGSPLLTKATSCQDLSCKVLWTIQADLEDGQLLYITGEPIALGCWNPEMALLMLPTQHENLWNAQAKVPCGTNFKYNYFIKGEEWPSTHLSWRPGPEYSVSIPLSKNLNQNIVVRDTWLTAAVHAERFPLSLWSSWLGSDDASLSYSDKNASSISPEDDSSMSSKRFSLDEAFKELSYSNEKSDTSSFNRNKGLVSSDTLSERDQPIEEPWFYQSSLFFLNLKDKLDFMVFNKEPNQYELNQKEVPDSSYHVKEDPEDGSKLTRVDDPISTSILINSSVCTVQRIAVLEDGKLVELLLEPVKSNVQCDSVYLGVITKLVPNMGGAFVNIGITRPSLMDIKHNREPFVFPPFRRRVKGKDDDTSVTTEHKGHSDTNHNQAVSCNDVEIVNGFEEVFFHDDSLQIMNDDFEEHEVDDDFDVPDIPKRNVNGSVVDYDRGVTDYDDYTHKIGHHLDRDATEEFLSIDAERFTDSQSSHPVLQDMKDSLSAHPNESKWDPVRKGTKVIVQVVKEGLGTKGPTLTAYPHLRSRFWILSTRCDRIGVSKKVSGVERTRLRVIAKTLQPPGFGITVRTVAAGHSLEELQKDLEGLISTWKSIIEHAKSAALAADEGVEGAVPVILHRAMGQTLSVAQDYFNEKVKEMVVDSPRTYHEITSYLQDIAPDLCDRVELYDRKIPIFDEYGIEEEINNMLCKRVLLANGGSLVIEQTEALVSIDVNGGHGMLGGQGNSQETAILEVNLAAAKQIARELRLRDIGGIIVVDFIDMVDDSNKRLVYEEVKKAVERDRSTVRVSELSRHGLMEITRKRVRPSVTFMISEPCTCCHATGRVEALETSFSKIEHEICRLQAMSEEKANPGNPKSWPKFVLRVDRYMCNYLTSGKRTRLALLSSSLKVWILLKVARGFTRGSFEVKPFKLDDKENNYENQVAISRLQSTEGRPYIPSTKLTLFPVKKWKTGRK